MKEIWTLMFMFFVVGMLSGCSVHFELGYHGKTGRDDRIQTKLINDQQGGKY